MEVRTNDWVEKNCYADLWFVVLRALGFEPMAMLGHTIEVDFEGDQWTFFKPCHSALRELYGVDVHELTVWRPLEEHVVEHLAAGKLVCTEVDAYWLPDVHATDYRTKHTKTTILIDRIDPEARRLGYFHNAGRFELEGDDYAGLMRAASGEGADALPLYAELVRVDRRTDRTPSNLANRALRLLRAHYEWKPSRNPFTPFGERIASDLPAMREAGLEHYQLWAFASVRQAGAAFELASEHLRWLSRCTGTNFDAAADRFAAISSANKSLILKGARAVATGKPLDPRELTSAMARDWDSGMSLLGAALGQAAH